MNNVKLILFILHTILNSPSLPISYPLPPTYLMPPSIHSSEGVGPPLGSQQRLAYQVEAGLSPSSLN